MLFTNFLHIQKYQYESILQDNESNTDHIAAHPSDSWKLRAMSTPLLGSVQTMRVSREKISLGAANVSVVSYLAAFGIHLPCRFWSPVTFDPVGLPTAQARAVLPDD